MMSSRRGCGTLTVFSDLIDETFLTVVVDLRKMFALCDSVFIYCICVHISVLIVRISVYSWDSSCSLILKNEKEEK